MKFKLAAIVLTFALLSACGPKEDEPLLTEAAPTSDDQFDAAVQEMTTAYFSHVPEAATQLGLSEDTVAGTNRRMMDRSLSGNAARNQSI